MADQLVIEVRELQMRYGSTPVLRRVDFTVERAEVVVLLGPNGAGKTTTVEIFYPIFAMPGWVQGIAQAFPVYWLGLGMRSALLPDSAVAAEIGQSWRHLETLGVLGAWAVAGLLLAPVILRRMTRRESGSAVEQRRQQAIQRIG